MAKPKQWLGQGARFSECGQYRYRLWRTWDDLPWVHFCMLNPSTADEHVEDPTVSRCIRYAMDWGYGGITVTNIFALRSTDPKVLYKHADPVGKGNDLAILSAITETDRTICAWGTHGEFMGRGEHVLKNIVKSAGYCLGMTKGGQPKHPLYLRRDLKPMRIDDFKRMDAEIRWLQAQSDEEGSVTVGRGRPRKLAGRSQK